VDVGGIRHIHMLVFLGKPFLSGVSFYREKGRQIGKKQHNEEKLAGCLNYFKRRKHKQ
jgi:hypothetical protein